VDDLWVEFRASPDPDLRNRLVVQYAPLVKYVVGRLGLRLPEHVDQQDLVSEGVIGLIDAIERFDPDRQNRFESFAVPRIHGAVIDCLRSQDWLPRRVRSEIKKVEETRSLLEGEMGATPTLDDVARAMGSSPDRVAELESTKASARMQSLDELDNGYDQLPVSDEDLLEGGQAGHVIEAVRGLKERDQIVIALYYFEQLTLAEIGEVLGVTESRVSQLRSRATQALRDALN
jgi:RNA polymerase sigma factor for flagellar operon FliA